MADFPIRPSVADIEEIRLKVENLPDDPVSTEWLRKRLQELIALSV